MFVRRTVDVGDLNVAGFQATSTKLQKVDFGKGRLRLTMICDEPPNPVRVFRHLHRIGTTAQKVQGSASQRAR